MKIDLIPGLSNVVRFPVEDRVAPSMDLLEQIGPDPREVGRVAAAFHLNEGDPGLQDAVDCETARYIAEQFTPLGLTAEALSLRLAELLDPVLGRAVLTCREHRKMAKAAYAAHELALKAKTEGGYWLAPLEEKADELTEATARLFLAAAARVREARGVNRAVGFARRGEQWIPHDPQGETEAWLAELERHPPAPVM